MFFGIQQFSLNNANLKTYLFMSMLKPIIYKEMAFTLRKLRIDDRCPNKHEN